MRRQRMIAVGGAMLAVFAGGFWTLAATRAAREDTERKVTATEVPEAALNALKALAAPTRITEFAEEIEHGRKFYEGSWTGAAGNVDALVTDAGELVEIEAIVSAEKVPLSVRTAVQREAGKNARLTFEKKTMVLYEAHFKTGDESREMILTPDGRRYHEENGQKDDHHERDEDDDD